LILKIQIRLPEATEIKKLEKKSLINYIYVGVPIKTSTGKTRHRTSSSIK